VELDVLDFALRHKSWAKFWKDRPSPRGTCVILDDIDRFSPGRVLLIIDLSQGQHLAINHATPAHRPFSKMLL
jgi:hypothetical protein